MASLGHTGRRRVVLGHPFNTLQHVIAQKSHHVLSKLTTLCWAAFTAILSHLQPAGRRLDTRGSMPSKQGVLCTGHTRSQGTLSRLAKPVKTVPMISKCLMSTRSLYFRPAPKTRPTPSGPLTGCSFLSNQRALAQETTSVSSQERPRLPVHHSASKDSS